MWNISASSAADISRGSAKKLRENTSNARCRAASGKRIAFEEVRRADVVEPLVDLGHAHVEQRQRRAGSMRARSRQPNVGLSATNPSALHGGVRGTRRKLSRSPSRCRSG